MAYAVLCVSCNHFTFDFEVFFWNFIKKIEIGFQCYESTFSAVHNASELSKMAFFMSSKDESIVNVISMFCSLHAATNAVNLSSGV